MPKYTVKSPIKFSGKRITEGEVEMGAKEAKPLLDAGVIEAAAGAKAESAENAGGKEKK